MPRVPNYATTASFQMISNLSLPDCDSTQKYTVSDIDVRILQNTDPLISYAIQTGSGDDIIQGVSEGIVNILGGGSMDYSE